MPWTWPGPAEEVREYAHSVSMPFRPLLDRVPKEKWPVINREINDCVQQYSRGKGIEFGAVVVVGSAIKA